MFGPDTDQKTEQTGKRNNILLAKLTFFVVGCWKRTMVVTDLQQVRMGLIDCVVEDDSGSSCDEDEDNCYENNNKDKKDENENIRKNQRKKIRCSKKMVIGPEDLVRIRHRINQIYVKQNVIVAPCLSKLYLSHDESDVGLTHLPRHKDDLDWFYFGMGLVAIIYDPEKNDVKITMFERNDVRLVWSLKWTDIVQVVKPAPNFHILNSMENGKTQHVGILYENRDVAELVSQTITLIYDRIKISKKCSKAMVETSQGSDSTIMKPNIETLSSTTTATMTLQRKPKKFERSSTLKDALLTRNKSIEVDMLQRKNLRSATVHEFTTNGHDTKNDFKREELIAAENRPRSECCEQTRLLKLSRADSFRKSRSRTFDVATPNNNNNKNKTRMSLQKSFDEAASKGKDNLVKILFKKRRISRTQSLQVEDRKNIKEHQQQEECSGTRDGSKQYERAVKLVKPRASTDTMLLCDSMRSLFEAGISARNERERKSWMKTLRSKDAQSTDLCVTEL